jgi:hypothetical protein
MEKRISFEKDRIPALAGLAAQTQAAGAGQYLAGLWRENLPMDLLWVSRGYQKTRKFGAPTWLWVSVGGRPGSVYYFRMTESYSTHKIRARVICLEWEAPGQELTRVDPKGSITLAAPIIKVQIYRSSWPFQVQYKKLKGQYYPDLLDHQPEGQIFCLLIGEAIQNRYRMVQALILQETSHGNNIYERIGSMVVKSTMRKDGFESEELHPYLWFGGVKDSIVTLV